MPNPALYNFALPKAISALSVRCCCAAAAALCCMHIRCRFPSSLSLSLQTACRVMAAARLPVQLRGGAPGFDPVIPLSAPICSVRWEFSIQFKVLNAPPPTLCRYAGRRRRRRSPHWLVTRLAARYSDCMFERQSPPPPPPHPPEIGSPPHHAFICSPLPPPPSPSAGFPFDWLHVGI